MDNPIYSTKTKNQTLSIKIALNILFIVLAILNSYSWIFVLVIQVLCYFVFYYKIVAISIYENYILVKHPFRILSKTRTFFNDAIKYIEFTRSNGLFVEYMHIAQRDKLVPYITQHSFSSDLELKEIIKTLEALKIKVLVEN